MKTAIYIAVMAIVTYLIRMIPFAFFGKKIKFITQAYYPFFLFGVEYLEYVVVFVVWFSLLFLE